MKWDSAIMSSPRDWHSSCVLSADKTRGCARGNEYKTQSVASQSASLSSALKHGLRINSGVNQIWTRTRAWIWRKSPRVLPRRRPPRLISDSLPMSDMHSNGPKKVDLHPLNPHFWLSVRRRTGRIWTVPRSRGKNKCDLIFQPFAKFLHAHYAHYKNQAEYINYHFYGPSLLYIQCLRKVLSVKCHTDEIHAYSP